MANKKIPARITVAWLRKYDACEAQVEIFKSLFPGGIGKITAAHIKKAVAAGIDPGWLAKRIDDDHDGVRCVVCHAETLPPADVARYLRSNQRAAR